MKNHEYYHVENNEFAYIKLVEKFIERLSQVDTCRTCRQLKMRTANWLHMLSGFLYDEESTHALFRLPRANRSEPSAPGDGYVPAPSRGSKLNAIVNLTPTPRSVWTTPPLQIP